MSSLDRQRIAAATGILFVVAIIISFALFQMPSVDDSAADIRADYVDDRGLALTGALIGGIAAMLLVVFVAAVRGMLRRQEEDDTLFSTIAFAAGLLTVGMIMAGITASAALAFKADEIAEDGAVRGLFDVSLMAYNVAGFPLTLFVLAVSGGLLLTHDMDRWLGWAGLAVGVVAASSLTAMFAEDGFWAFDGAWGFISGIVVAAWMVAVSVVMMFPQVVHHVHPAMPAPMAHA